ncbi:MAG: NAD-binding protein [Candidatus Magnetomorum sp.]|nr:NAD-binding protein [Candidatus Magnetomorum sp.]
MERSNSFDTLKGHVVICNCNEKVKTIVEELQNSTVQASLDVALIVQDPQLWHDHQNWHPIVTGAARFIVIYGSPTDESILQKAQISKARAAIILADPIHGELADAPSSLTAIAIERANPQVHTVMELLSSLNRPHIEQSEINEIICLGEISEKLLASSCITPGVTNIFENLLTTEDGTSQIFIDRIPKKARHMSFRQLVKQFIYNEAPFILIGFIAHLHSQKIIVINPKTNGPLNKDTPLSGNTKLVTMGYRKPDFLPYL